MNYFIKEEEMAAFRNRTPGGLADRLYTLLRERTFRNTREDKLVQSADTQEWYHLVWERMADAGFVYRAEKDAGLGRWIHDRTMEMVRMSLDDWIGPWYRVNLRKRQAGALETAHITLGVCEAYENAREVFDEGELQEIRKALHDKGLFLCRRFADEIYEGKNGFNWFMVLLNGYGSAALVLDEKEEIAHARELLERFAGFYNQDCYGESVQYSNYASLHLAFFMEGLIRSGYGEAETLPLHCLGNLMGWYAASLQRVKERPGYDCPVPRTFAFGDSSNLFRPTAGLLAHVAVRLKDKAPVNAGLATWLFETLYGQEKSLPDELATFGFFNQFGYHSIVMYPAMHRAVSPEEAGLPLVMGFDIGHIILRDRWEDPKMALALAAGYQPLQVSVHRHLDQNSFQLTIGRERMLIDPGHCCYRLRTQERSKDEVSHNTISIRYQGNLVRQREVVPQKGLGEASVYNKLLVNERFQDMQVVISDATRLYEAPVKKAVRAWILRMPDLVVVCDYVLAEEPVELITRLVANNRDNRLGMERQGEDFLTLTRGDSVLEVHQVFSQADEIRETPALSFDWSFLHDYYHPLPNQAGQGKEGSALVYVWTSRQQAREHRRVQVLVGRDGADGQYENGWYETGQRDGRRYEACVRENRVLVSCEGSEILAITMDRDGITFQSREKEPVRYSF